MAPLTRRQKKALAAAPPVPDPEDRISNLPKEIKEEIVSFLPAHDAVRTCVLARTWRDVWKSSRRLLITGDSVKEVRDFVDGLLRARGDASLDVSKFQFHQVKEVDYDGYIEYEDVELDGDDDQSLRRWIRSVLEYQTKVLRIDINAHGDLNGCLQMGNKVLVSQHLTKLELTGVWFICRWLNLDGCPALEHPEINKCGLNGLRKMTSLSLKRLIIRSCDSNEDHKRIQICVPRVVSLWLDVNDVRTPLLERMPDLVAATVKISSFQDWCNCDDHMACYHVTRAGDTSDIDSDSDEDNGSGDYARQNTNCVVLEGLAQARDLVLIDDSQTYIFRRDLRWSPTFYNLKTLKLIEEYKREPADCSVLECMLEHAPLLEKLTFILKKVLPLGKYKVEIKGYPDTKVASTKISQHLQTVKIICEDVNGISLNVLNLLYTLKIRFETTVTK